MENSHRRVWLAWMAVGLLVVLCGTLAGLQYRWIGKTTEAERTRLRGELHARLGLLARAFNEELRSACAPGSSDAALWFRRMAVVASPAERPAGWNAGVDGLLVLPRFGGPARSWTLLDVNMDYVRGTVVPALTQRYLGVDGKAEYHVELVTAGQRASMREDDWIPLADEGPGGGPRHGGPGPGFGGFENGGPPPPPDAGRERWRLFVSHSDGSLEALVEQTRRVNLAISAGILLLILAVVTALAQFTRRAHWLAQQQMDFVAGVSHELRTPLAVIRTAAYNLRGKLVNSPEQVERYGALIQDESERLGSLVEQVLRFASSEAGHAIGTPTPMSIAEVLEHDLRFENGGPPDGWCVEKKIEAGMPPVMGDRLAMRQALQNLIDNAMKYGAGESSWIGVRVAAVKDAGGEAVEIRVADRGPGIPPDEQGRIFEPFFRGARAMRDQVHGTGLGLSLTKKIVEAHGGTIRVNTAPAKGTEFIVRIPSAPVEMQDELAHSVS